MRWRDIIEIEPFCFVFLVCLLYCLKKLLCLYQSFVIHSALQMCLKCLAVSSVSS